MKSTDSRTRDDCSTQKADPMSKAVVSRGEADHAVTHRDMFSQLAVPGSEDNKQREKRHSPPALTPAYTTLTPALREVPFEKEKIDNRHLPSGQV